MKLTRLSVVAAMALLAGTSLAQPVSSAFTYQGRLLQGGSAPSGLYDFQFKLYDSAAGFNQLGVADSKLNVQVNGGLFTAQIDFGNQYGGAKRWLQIEVRNAGGGAYTILMPRQELTAAPHAMALALPMQEAVASNMPLVTLENMGSGGAIKATANSSAGWDGAVYATSDSLHSNGVVGIAHYGDLSYGVWGKSTEGYGVVGESGLAGGSFRGATGLVASSTREDHLGVAIHALGGHANMALLAESSEGSPQSVAVRGISTSFDGTGIHGTCDSGLGAYGVWGTSLSGEGVRGNGLVHGGLFDGNIGLQGTSTLVGNNGIGVLGVGGPGHVGVRGESSAGSSASYGMVGVSTALQGNGVKGEASNGSSAWGILGVSTTGQAGHFSGNVQVTGNLSKASGTFEIDHPLDPANKLLYHSFVESPDMLNIYNGNAGLDGQGMAVVVMPEWFEALNMDFRYQLTAVGAPGPNLYIAQTMRDGVFMIAGGTPGGTVSWQVTGVRQDPWANAHRVQVEVQKAGANRGRFLHPELYGMPEELRMDAEKLADHGLSPATATPVKRPAPSPAPASAPVASKGSR